MLPGILWAIFSGSLAARLLFSALGTWRVFHRSESCTSGPVLASASRAAALIGVKQEPRVFVSQDVVSPMALAFRTPRLLIPRAALLDPSMDWFAVFCHELAHVRRRDGWFRLAAELVIVLLPWQPILWLLKRELYLQTDQACDDWTVASGVDAIEFAALLTRWIPRKAPLLAPGITSSSTVARRVLRLLALRQTPEHRVSSAL